MTSTAASNDLKDTALSKNAFALVVIAIRVIKVESFQHSMLLQQDGGRTWTCIASILRSLVNDPAQG
jgi:hypothetical protein